MLLLTEPSEALIRRFLAEQAGLPLSYTEVGASRGRPPAGYPLNRYRRRIGAGEADYRRAGEALCRWTVYALDWTRPCWPTTPVAVDATVGVLARHCGFWSLNAGRVVYLVDEVGPVARTGFALGTLPGHVEQGEERLTVAWRRDTDAVWYELFAFARPRHPLARLGYPVTRLIQRRFARDSGRAMAAACQFAGQRRP